jgi:hypothetical protein
MQSSFRIGTHNLNVSTEPLEHYGEYALSVSVAVVDGPFPIRMPKLVGVEKSSYGHHCCVSISNTPTIGCVTRFIPTAVDTRFRDGDT